MTTPDSSARWRTPSVIAAAAFFAVVATACARPPETDLAVGTVTASAVERSSPESMSLLDSGTPVRDSGPNADPTAPEPTRTGWTIPSLAAAPQPPRLTPQPADYTTPAAVAAAYIVAWCAVPAGASAVSGVEQAVPWLTVDGWRDDHARAIAAPPPTTGMSTLCGSARADEIASAPASDQTVWVAIKARQTWLRDGVVIGDHQISQVRRVVRAGDGRWLVDVRVNAG